MTVSVTFIHTFPALVQRFEELMRTHLPDARANHVVETGFLDAEFERGYLTNDEEERLLAHVRIAEQRGDAAAVVTCSFLGTSADKLKGRVGIPLIRVDEAMVREAMSSGTQVGVIATASSSLVATRGLIDRLIAEGARPVPVVQQLCDGAFEALDRGDVETHDAAVRDGLLKLASECDVIVLSQASMARVAQDCEDELGDVAVLTSPERCMAQLAGALGGTALG